MTWTRRTCGRRPRRKELPANAAAFRRRWGNSGMILWWNVALMPAAEVKSAPGPAHRSAGPFGSVGCEHCCLGQFHPLDHGPGSEKACPIILGYFNGLEYNTLFSQFSWRLIRIWLCFGIRRVRKVSSSGFVSGIAAFSGYPNLALFLELSCFATRPPLALFRDLVLAGSEPAAWSGADSQSSHASKALFLRLRASAR